MDLRARAHARRLLLLSVLAAVIGSLAGLAAYVLIHLIALITNLAIFGRTGWSLPSFRTLDPSPRLVIAPVLGAIAVAGLAKWAPIIRGHGIPEAMEAILRKQSRIAPRTAIAKPVSAAIAIGTGGPFGAEGPIIVTGGSIGSLIGQVIDVSPSERKILLASGAAAGMSATFGAPLASVMLAIELLLFEFSPRAFIPLVVAASISGGIHSAIFGSGPLFHVPPHHYAGLGQLPAYAALGLACGALAVIIAKGLFAVEHGFRRLPVGEFWHPAIGAVFFGVVGLAVPRALGVGYDAIDDALGGHLTVGVLAGLLVAKLVAWWVALGSGTSGGTLAPILLISATFGGLLGRGAANLAPGLGISAGAIADVAMAATFGSATRAPFTAIVFVFELTRDYNVVLPLMLASVMASLVTTAFLSDSLMTEKLTRRGVRVGGELHVDVLRTTLVGDVMSPEVVTIPAGATVGEATAVMSEAGHGAYPVVDEDGRCVALLEQRDLLVGDPPPGDTALDVAHRDVVSVSTETPLVEALELMVEEGVDHLPVIDDERLVGMCTRADIVRARADQIALDHRQSGWLRPIVSRRRPRRVLLVGNRTLGDDSIASALLPGATQGRVHVHVLVPIGPHDGVGAADRLAAQIGALRALGLSASGEILAARPVAAVRLALRAEAYDEIILSTLPPGVSGWLRMDAGARIERLSRLPVTHVVSPGDGPPETPPPRAT
ncbi:MAG TPA: chloride channel protein [Acidimicrobiia bacterium]|nr:chloride channel protein [Acidimicrobiia bacterium]